MSESQEKGLAALKRMHDENGTQVLWRDKVLATGLKADIISGVVLGVPTVLLGLAVYKFPVIAAASAIGAATGASFATGTRIVSKNGVVETTRPFRMPPAMRLAPLAASAFVLWKASGVGSPLAMGICAGLTYTLGNTFEYTTNDKTEKK